VIPLIAVVLKHSETSCNLPNADNDIKPHIHPHINRKMNKLRAIEGEIAFLRQAHNLKVVGSNPTPATNFWA
jgi:hypothetical protein